MFTTYIIRSLSSGKYYYGLTSREVKTRLREHHEGKSSYTRKYRPWKLVWYACLSIKEQARDFEKYLKTPSGHAFSRKRFLQGARHPPSLLLLQSHSCILNQNLITENL
jgi:putative endonuclease